MGRFTVRVVLHDANWLNYSQLYMEMAKFGFTDVIVGDSGTLYKMPPGEYDLTGYFTPADVLDLAHKAASATGLKDAVFVTEAGTRTWTGLNVVASQAA